MLHQISTGSSVSFCSFSLLLPILILIFVLVLVLVLVLVVFLVFALVLQFIVVGVFVVNDVLLPLLLSNRTLTIGKDVFSSP